MHPQTPKNQEKKPAGLTPSFTFGSLGPLPSSFRFVLPRNMNLLSSLSPHRLFNKFCKGVGEAEEKIGDSRNEGKKLPLEMRSPTHKLLRTRTDIGLGESFHDSMSNFNGQLSSQNFPNVSTVELFGTADELDIWSFASDSHAVPMNLTAITEAADNKETFFSPPELFLEQSPLDSEFSVSQSLQTQGTPVKTVKTVKKTARNDVKSSKKRKLSSVHGSPCTKAAIRASILGSPERETTPFSPTQLKDLKKVWTSSLDDELLRCFRKYNTLKSLRASKEMLFKGTSQNKILSRMLEKKTGVYRTQKQISGRLLKLLKPGPPKITVELAAESTPMTHAQQMALQATPSSQKAPLAIPSSLTATFEKFHMSFRYKDVHQGSHVFAAFTQETRLSLANTHHLSIDGARKAIPQQNSQFLTDYDAIAPLLKAQDVAIHNVCCYLDLDPNFSDLSSPVSPMTSPRQFVAENGSFLSYLNVVLRGNLFSKSFVTLQSNTTVYKNAKQMLFKSEESVNGYREGNNDFRLEIPFLNHFWAGFLTYIVSGSSDFRDLENITIVQIISDDSGPEIKIYGYFVYRFSPATSGSGDVRVDVINLSPEAEDQAQGDIDEQETILASSPFRSSPCKPSPNIMNLRIHTDLAHAIGPGPSTAPIFNSGLVHENNVNYEFSNMAGADGPHRPSMPVSKSTTNVNFEKRPTSVAMLHANHSFNHGVRHHSAGQMGSFNPNLTPAPAPGILGESCFYDQPSMGPLIGQPYLANHSSGMLLHLQQMAMNHISQGPGNVHQHPQQPQQMFPNAQAIMPPNMGQGPWPISTNYQIPHEINSAPASQLQFFPPHGNSSRDNIRKGREVGPALKFHTLLQYDPSKGVDQEAKKQNPGTNFHQFPAKPEIVFQAENNRLA